MRVKRDSGVYLIGRYLSEPCVTAEVLRRDRRRSSYVLLRPVNAQVRVRGTVLRLGIPTASVITEGSLSCRDPDLVLEEDAWVEAKQVVESDVVEFLGDFTVKELPVLRGLRDASSEGVKCSVLDLENSVSLDEYLGRLINVRHILMSSSLRDVVLESVKGSLQSYWTTHFLLSGLELPAGDVIVRGGVRVEDIPKLKLLLKPLLSVDEHVVVGELPLNKSIVLNGIFNGSAKDLFLEVLLRTIVYTC